MMDAKTIKSALEQLETERGIPKEKIVETIQEALAAAYKKDYGKKGQIIKAEFDLPSGQVKFYQIKIVVDESMLKKEDEEEEEDILEEVTPVPTYSVPSYSAPVSSIPSRPTYGANQSVDPLTLDARTRYKMMRSQGRYSSNAQNNLWGSGAGSAFGRAGSASDDNSDN